MVVADSPKISRVPGYSGSYHRDRSILTTGLSPSSVQLSNCARLSLNFLTLSDTYRYLQYVPLHQYHNGCNLSHGTGLGSSRFARHYFGNRSYFLFFKLLRCFSSPAYLTYTIYSCTHDSTPYCRVPPFGFLRINAC